MKNINILHVTDLHFGSSPNRPIGNLRDNSLSEEFVREIRSDPHNRFIADIKHLSRDFPIDLIACTGDFGWKGKEESVDQGIKYLAKLAKDIQVDPNRVIVTPGNHDLAREAKIGEELNKFSNECRSEGFIYPQWNEPVVLPYKEIPIIALNTCLGGTEHALYGLTRDFWKDEKELLKKKESDYEANKYNKIESELLYQVQSMDIPAVGLTQLDSSLSYLDTYNGNFTIVLMHHNPVPTSNVDIRPYANLIDSGPLIMRLMENGRKRIIVLHGHTHCESGLSVQPPKGNEGGFLASIGNRGLSGGPNAAASLFEIITTDTNYFIKADVYYIERNGDIFNNNFQYTLQNRFIDPIDIEENLHKLPKDRAVTFKEVSKILDKDASESLARVS